MYSIPVPSHVWLDHAVGDDYWYFGVIKSKSPGKFTFDGEKPTSAPGHKPGPATTGQVPKPKPEVAVFMPNVQPDNK